ncbi:MAG TPA: hypothetical protein PKK26_09435 [Candidatus Wallbacteria bacterium]|nr:hypothetical protein [Candidatus Wallbacteria bacterium]
MIIISPRKNGMTTAIIVAMVAIISILFYSLSSLLRQEAHLAGRYSRISVLANIADAACAIGLNELEAQLNDQNSKLFTAIYQKDLNGQIIPTLFGKGNELTYTPANYPLLKEIVDQYSKMYPGIKVTIKIEVKYLREFSDIAPIALKNSAEKQGVAEVTARAWSDAMNVSQTIREKRAIKLTCSALPVVSRFSFFLRDAFKQDKINKDITIAMPDGGKENPCGAFNLIQVNENGTPAPDGMPVIVRNTNGGQTGWVFLGSGGNETNQKKPILINIAGGAKETGEDHHLFRVSAPPPASCYLNKSVGNAGKGKQKPDDEAAFYESGFSDDLVSQNSDQLVGLNSVVDIYCRKGSSTSSSASAIKALSSVFHFFDSPDAPGGNGNINNVMLGNVYRAFATLGIFRCDKSGGNFNRAGFFKFIDSGTHKMLWDTGDANHSPAKNGEPAPCTCNHCTDPTNYPNPVPGHKNVIFLTDEQYAMWSFGLDWPNFQNAMSDIKYNTYIHSAYPVSTTGGIPEDVEKMFEPKLANKYNSIIPKDDATFTKNIVKGYADITEDLNKMKFIKTYFNERQTMLVSKDEQKDFWDEVVKGGKLTLNKVVVFDKDVDVEIPVITDIERGGIIVSQKSVKIKKIDIKDRKSIRDGKTLKEKSALAASLLTIVSLGDKIIVDGNPVCAHLVSLYDKKGAIEGSLTVTDPQKTVDIFGGIAVNSIKLDEFTGMRKNASGSPIIEYNPILYPDPDPKTKASYLTNEFAYSVNMMPTIQEWTVTSEW